MLSDARVAWREGIFLRQQHFQQQDRHLDALVRARAASAGPHPWGITRLVINRDLAALGKFAVEELAGVLPDGLCFSIPGDLRRHPRSTCPPAPAMPPSI